MRNLIFFVVVAYAGYWAANTLGLIEFGRPVVKVHQGTLSVDSSSRHMEFTVGAPIELTGMRVLRFSAPHSSMAQMGVEREAAFLRERDYQEFKSIVSRGKCPASFLNSHAVNTLLFAGDPSVVSSLRRASPEEGASLALYGRKLSFYSGKINGLNLQNFSLTNVTPLLVESVH